jgi:deoxyadenosine/deoxycytidine kinase
MIAEEVDFWDSEQASVVPRSGIYVAISGNTGAGKSTLVNAIVDRARELPLTTVGVNERRLHHPLLKLMFSESQRYAFGVQLHFLLQRHLVILRNLNLGKTIVIERSHLDDVMFVEQHRAAGNISEEEYRAYRTIAGVLHEKLPLPDVFVCLDAEPELSLARLHASEERGERPREFPSEEVKRSFVTEWYERYRVFHDDIVSQACSSGRYAGMHVLRRSAKLATEAIVAEVMGGLRSVSQR